MDLGSPIYREEWLEQGLDKLYVVDLLLGSIRWQLVVELATL